MKKFLLFSFLVVTLPNISGQSKATAVVNADQGTYIINKNIYGQFSEHLGRCVYEGIWVGENSSIPNTNGYRNDVIAALKRIKIPNLRWPGGCFADEYHWMDGIGPREKRAKMINTHWGGVVEDNSFGTNEFLNFCELIGTEPYICGNLGSGSVEEMSKWVEYMTSDAESPMANLRRQYGREKPWKVKYFGVGNESWGCGGNMTAEGYAENYRRYATFCRNYGENKLYKIAGGANSSDYRWTEVLMKNIPLAMMQGISLHNYCFTSSWGDKGNATGFSEDDYFKVLENGLKMDDLISRHSMILDMYDPKKNIAFVVDEWGVWYNSEPGTNPGFLYQQNSLRDAILAGEILNIFHKHCDRVRMANIAQMANVLQSIILTDKEKMILTPTYYVFDMYKVHQDATMLPITVSCPDYSRLNRSIKSVSATASVNAEGTIHITFINADAKNNIEVSCDIRGSKTSKITDGQIINGKETGSFNTFENPYQVQLLNFKDAKYKNGTLSLNLPAHSLVTIELK